MSDTTRTTESSQKVATAAGLLSVGPSELVEVAGEGAVGLRSEEVSSGAVTAFNHLCVTIIMLEAVCSAYRVTMTTHQSPRREQR